MTAAPRAPTRARSSANGNLYCPCAPRTLLELGPLAPPPPKNGRRPRRKTAEPARYKLGRLTADDADGYHRVQCPAATGKIRCPRGRSQWRWTGTGPEILQPPEHPPACCTQRPSRAGRDRARLRSTWRTVLRPPHRRRTRLRHRQGPRRHDIAAAGAAYGTGPPDAVHHHLLLVRNQRITAWNARQEENQRRAAAGLRPRTQRRRRRRSPSHRHRQRITATPGRRAHLLRRNAGTNPRTPAHLPQTPRTRQRNTEPNQARDYLVNGVSGGLG